MSGLTTTPNVPRSLYGNWATASALLQMGDCFLEVVSPVDGGYERNSTSVKLLRKNGGDCGYMVILQVDDIAKTSTLSGRIIAFEKNHPQKRYSLL